MRVVLRLLLLSFALLSPLIAADPIYGVWKMRESNQTPGLKSEVMKVEVVPDGTRFTIDMVTAKAKLSYYYVTKLDGQPVTAMMKKKPFSKIQVRKISPFEYETTMLDLTTEQNYKTTISQDGRTLTNEGTGQANGQPLTVHIIFEKAQDAK
jgi:hypothetical protein